MVRFSLLVSSLQQKNNTRPVSRGCTANFISVREKSYFAEEHGVFKYILRELSPPYDVTKMGFYHLKKITRKKFISVLCSVIGHLHDDVIWIQVPDCFEGSYCIQYCFGEESLVRDTNLHYKDCSEMHSGWCSQMTSSFYFAWFWPKWIVAELAVSCYWIHLSGKLLLMFYD